MTATKPSTSSLAATRAGFNHRLSLLLIRLLFVVAAPWSVQAALPCNNNKECTTRLRQGSECLDGFCSNPFRTGCLRTMGVVVNVDGDQGPKATRLIDTNVEQEPTKLQMIQNLPKRTCNSDDNGDESDCQMNLQFQYPQVRIHNGNWESSIFYAWVLQILLMEVLGAPATVGLTSNTTAASSFYSPTNTLEYSAAAYPFSALRDAEACHTTEGECAQVLPEVWNGQLHEWTEALNEGYIEPLEGDGQVGKGSWYVPKFTAIQDDSLVSFYGLSGEENRQKLANAFLKPTTWLDYCQLVSSDNCSTPDSTALHFPEVNEQESYFNAGSYQGHFRMTPENNCTTHPDSCMGHIVGPGCTWSTNIDAQLYWNDIKLTPDGPLLPNGGYEYSSLIQIWRAADATKSNVLFWWWRPEALIEEFHATDSQFQMVLLPEATDTCSRARVGTDQRCSEDIMVRRGDPEGACDQEAHALQKVVSKAFKEETNQQPLVAKSPSFDLIKAVKITDLEINNMLRRWIDLKTDPYGNDARQAVCGWVVDNIDILLDFIPAGYPKRLADQSNYQTGFLYAAISLGIISAMSVLAFARMAYFWRQAKVFIYAQAHIVYLILFGFFLVALGAITVALEPSSGVCKTQIWLVNLGYTIELVPLLVKIAAINKMLSAASKMKRVKISRNQMFKQVGLIVGTIVVFLLVWTIMDPPQAVVERVLRDPQSLTVDTSLTCSSEKGFWRVIALTWQGLLLLIATVLAFQSRDVIQAFNESQRLGTMIYSHMIFLILRGVIYWLGAGEILLPNIIAGISSVLLSLDTLLASLIYFLPKCLEARNKDDGGNSMAFARGSAVVTAIERKAAIEYHSHNFTSNASMTDALGKVLPVSQGGGGGKSTLSQSFKSQDSNGKNNTAVGDQTVSPRDSAGSFINGASFLRNRLVVTLSGLPEVSGESGDHELSGPLYKPEDPIKKLISRRLSAESNKSNRKLESRIPSFNTDTDLLPEGRSAHSVPMSTSDDDGGYSSDSVDSGGPRFNNPKANEELERSVQLTSADLDIYESDDDDLSNNSRRKETFSQFGYSQTGRVNRLGILPETDEEIGSYRDCGHESE